MISKEKMIFDEREQIGGSFLDLERAQKWDERRGKIGGNYAETAKKIAQMLELTKESTLIDLGCGTGLFTIELSKYCKTVYAVDVSPIVLEILQNKINENEIKNIECINKGILEFLCEHQHADAFVIQTALHHLPDFWKALSINQMGRITGVNGAVYLSDVIFSFPLNDYQKHFSEMLEFIGSKGDEGLTKDAEKHLLEEFSTFDWVIEGMFEREGFEVISKVKQSTTYCDYVFRKKAEK